MATVSWFPVDAGSSKPLTFPPRTVGWKNRYSAPPLIKGGHNQILVVFNSVNSGFGSPVSARTLFTDNTRGLFQPTDMEDLKNDIDTVRAAGSFAAFPWTNAPGTSTTQNPEDINDLRQALSKVMMLSRRCIPKAPFNTAETGLSTLFLRPTHDFQVWGDDFGCIDCWSADSISSSLSSSSISDPFQLRELDDTDDTTVATTFGPFTDCEKCFEGWAIKTVNPCSGAATTIWIRAKEAYVLRPGDGSEPGITFFLFGGTCYEAEHTLGGTFADCEPLGDIPGGDTVASGGAVTTGSGCEPVLMPQKSLYVFGYQGAPATAPTGCTSGGNPCSTSGSITWNGQLDKSATLVLWTAPGSGIYANGKFTGLRTADLLTQLFFDSLCLSGGDWEQEWHLNINCGASPDKLIWPGERIGLNATALGTYARVGGGCSTAAQVPLSMFTYCRNDCAVKCVNADTQAVTTIWLDGDVFYGELVLGGSPFFTANARVHVSDGSVCLHCGPQFGSAEDADVPGGHTILESGDISHPGTCDLLDIDALPSTLTVSGFPPGTDAPPAGCPGGCTARTVEPTWSGVMTKSLTTLSASYSAGSGEAAWGLVIATSTTIAHAGVDGSNDSRWRLTVNCAGSGTTIWEGFLTGSLSPIGSYTRTSGCAATPASLTVA
jgi:hypothetical protein